MQAITSRLEAIGIIWGAVAILWGAAAILGELITAVQP
jgi:hypothetical protein